MYIMQVVKLPTVFEWLPDSSTAALEAIKPESPTTDVIEIDEQGQVLESRTYR